MSFQDYHTIAAEWIADATKAIDSEIESIRFTKNKSNLISTAWTSLYPKGSVSTDISMLVEEENTLCNLFYRIF